MIPRNRFAFSSKFRGTILVYRFRLRRFYRKRFARHFHSFGCQSDKRVSLIRKKHRSYSARIVSPEKEKSRINRTDKNPQEIYKERKKGRKGKNFSISQKYFFSSLLLPPSFFVTSLKPATSKMSRTARFRKINVDQRSSGYVRDWSRHEG